jgi:hypothetical protein
MVIYIITSALTWFSGVYIGRGEDVLGLLLYLPCVLLGLIDFIIYWVLIFRR